MCRWEERCPSVQVGAVGSQFSSVQVEISCGPDVYEEYNGVSVCRLEYSWAPNVQVEVPWGPSVQV